MKNNRRLKPDGEHNKHRNKWQSREQNKMERQAVKKEIRRAD